MECITDSWTLPLVCAVVDCQGFMVGKKFYVRELAICSENHTACVDVRTNLQLDTLNLRYQTEKIHGLSRNTLGAVNTFDQESIGTVLKSWQALVSNPAQPYLACKNSQLAKILEENKINYINLETGTIKAPKLGALDKVYCPSNPWFCFKHTELPINLPSKTKLRCAARKASHLWKWIQNMKKTSEELVALEKETRLE